MSVNNSYRFVIPNNTGKEINIPLEIKWDFYGRDDSIEVYEEDVIEEIIGIPKDFEIAHFSHKPYIDNGDEKSSIKYDFNFFSGTTLDIPTSVSTDWQSTYLSEGFSSTEIYTYSKPFSKSFFKLDFYDTNDSVSQTIQFTIIIPVQQGKTEIATISSVLPDVNIRKPEYELDFVGDKEGYFIYWLRDKEMLNIDTFYMSAKFFSGRQGVFIRMMNRPQSTLSNKFVFKNDDYFYYKVVLDYTDFTYSVLDYNNIRVGTQNSIKWYEYVNP
jgi:hypothetical protein